MNIKFLMDEARFPTRASEQAAGWDLYAAKDCVIEPGEMVLVHTGIALEIPDGYCGKLYPRSGLSTKKGLRLANCVGVIDSDYRGEIMVAMYNDSSFVREIEVGDRIAQIIIESYTKIDGFTVVEELSETSRGDGGFGSTGRK